MFAWYVLFLENVLKTKQQSEPIDEIVDLIAKMDVQTSSDTILDKQSVPNSSASELSCKVCGKLSCKVCGKYKRVGNLIQHIKNTHIVAMRVVLICSYKLLFIINNLLQWLQYNTANTAINT